MIVAGSIASAVALAAACGIDVRGSSGGAAGSDAASGDATIDADGLVDGEAPALGDADIGDAGVGVPFDAGLADAACDATTLDDPLTGIDATKWLVTSQGNPGRPAPVRAGNGGSARNIISMIADHYNSARGGLWLANAVPTRALDVQFRAAADCGSWLGDGCADGFTAVWLDASSVPAGGIATAVNAAGNGSTLGVPNNLGGGGFAIDLFQNSNLNDPPSPALEVLAIRSTQAPASYPWVVQGVSSYAYGNAYVHTYDLHLRNAQLTVSVDGKPVMANVAVPATTQSVFGFTAATGGQNGVFYVWDFHAAFFACDP